MKKITLATLKTFIRKNQDNLYIKVKSSFDSNTDCVMSTEDNFRKINGIDFTNKNTLGITENLFLKKRKVFTP